MDHEDVIILNLNKETKKYSKGNIGMGFLFIACIVLMFTIEDDYGIEYLKNNIFLTLIIIKYCLFFVYEFIILQIIENKRIIYLTKDGIITKLFFYKKQFSWDKYVVKKYAEDEFIYFSRKKKLKKKKYYLDFYADYHPLSCVRILLITGEYDFDNYLGDILVNAVEETHFKEKMKEWNIEIENYDLS